MHIELTHSSKKKIILHASHLISGSAHSVSHCHAFNEVWARDTGVGGSRNQMGGSMIFSIWTVY